MPRANPPPSAMPMAGSRVGTTGGAAFRDSSLPKAWTVRMIFPRLFTAPPHLQPVRPELLNPYMNIKMPYSATRVQGTVVLYGITTEVPESDTPTRVTVTLTPSWG